MKKITAEGVFRWFAWLMAVIVPCGILLGLFEEEGWPLPLRLGSGALVIAAMVWTLVKLSRWAPSGSSSS